MKPGTQHAGTIVRTQHANGGWTPGPWRVTPVSERFAKFEVLGPEHEVVCAVLYNDGNGAASANAALIASAPALAAQVQKLRAAVERAAQVMEHAGVKHPVLGQLRAALAEVSP